MTTEQKQAIRDLILTASSYCDRLHEESDDNEAEIEEISAAMELARQAIADLG